MHCYKSQRWITLMMTGVFMKNIFSLIVIIPILFFLQSLSAEATTEKATFAGGCYWCMEEVYDKLDGVVSATSGFAASPRSTGKAEAVEVVYDPEKVSYQKLLEAFWKNIDPSNTEGQFCDRGPQYRSGIFYHNEQQRIQAEESKLETEKHFPDKKVVTPIIPAGQFFPAEANQQDYYKNHAAEYKQYKMRCGRAQRLRQLWGEKKSE
jgi:peptide-methionine (S)-S-oxide reductase